MRVEESYGSRTETPDGCKGVQIDSSMDMQEEERFKEIGGSKGFISNSDATEVAKDSND